MQQRVKTFNKGESSAGKRRWVQSKSLRRSDQAAGEEGLLSLTPTGSHTWKTVKEAITTRHMT